MSMSTMHIFDEWEKRKEEMEDQLQQVKEPTK